MSTSLVLPGSRRVVRAVLVSGTAALLVGLGASAAGAHVTVTGDGAYAGATDTVLSFRVPTEKEGATTTKVEIKLPATTPLAGVHPEAIPGWTATTQEVTYPTPITTDDGTVTKGPGSVTFTAAQGSPGIPAESYATFRLLVGMLPKGVQALSFPTVQTYSDGTVVSWIEPVPAGGDEPEHPAPTLQLAEVGFVAPGGSGAAPGSAPATAELATKASVTTARTLGLVGLVAGLLGLALGGAAFWRAGRRSPLAPRSGGEGTA